MAANRKISGLAAATGLGALLLLLLFQGGIDDVFRPERAPAEQLADGPGPVPGVVPNEPAPAAEKPSAAPVKKGAAKPAKEDERPRIPVEIAVIDAETGAALLEAQPHLKNDEGEWLVLRPSDGVFVHPEATEEIGLTAHVRVRFDLPDGYALQTPGEQFLQERITIYTKRARATFAAWRHADVQVRVTDFHGDPVAGARIGSASLSGRGRKFAADRTNADGWTTVRGIPAVHGEKVSVTAWTDQRHQEASGWILDSWTPTRMTVVLPEKPNNHMIGIGGGAGGAFGSRSSRRIIRKAGNETVAVEVYHRDGRPAVGTMVAAQGSGLLSTGRTDQNGRVVLEKLAPGKVSVRVSETGFVMGKSVWIDLVAGESAKVVIHEAPQRWITGVVLDEDGRALASASVVLKGSSVSRLMCLDRGLQHLNVLTGPDGRFAFPNVPPEAITVQAEYGTRKGKAKVGDAGPVTVRFRRR